MFQGKLLVKIIASYVNIVYNLLVIKYKGDVMKNDIYDELSENDIYEEMKENERRRPNDKDKSNKVTSIMFAISKYLPEDKQFVVLDKLKRCPDDKLDMILAVPKKEPVVALVLGLFLGYLGIDRFYIGDIGLGIGKLLTFGGCGIWHIIDWFLIMRATREKNFEVLMNYLSF